MILRGKNAVITGANRGIGKKTVEVFAAQGAHIWACARKQTEEFEEYVRFLSKKYQVLIEPIYFDLGNSEEIKEAMRLIMATRRDIDILVNNAGIVAESKLFHMTTIDEMKEIFEVNFFAPMLITQYISKKMLRQRRGSIINMASIAALDGEPAQLEYVSSKAALIGATKKLAIELGENGIRVNAIAPGVTDTDMGHEIKEEILRLTLNKTVMKRMGTTDEIANLILFLASDLASYITGQVIRVDGGANL